MQASYIQKALPDLSLRECIRQYTFVDFPFEKAQHMEFTVMPSSHVRMILFLGEPSLHEEKESLQAVDRYSLTGFVAKPHLFVPMGTLRQVMIHFTSWGIQQFIGFPLSEITDTRADLNHIFKLDLDELCEELRNLSSILEKTAVLDHFFRAQLNTLKAIDDRAKPLTQYILKTNGKLRLEDVCKNLLLGERTAQRIIHNAVGVNFKFFAKLVRLEHVQRLMVLNKMPLTEIALQAGYFDQAHFIHDFKEAFGESPSAFLERQQLLVWNRVR